MISLSNYRRKYGEAFENHLVIPNRMKLRAAFGLAAIVIATRPENY
jgi:hypothetical protein